jgi:hypothetical protein
MTLATRSASCTQFCFKQPTSRKFQGYLTIGGQRNSQIVQRIFLSEEWSINSVQLTTRSVLQIPLNLTQISKRTDSHGRGPELLSAKKTQSILRQKETGRIHSNKTNSLIIHPKTQSQTICYLHINCTNFLKLAVIRVGILSSLKSRSELVFLKWQKRRHWSLPSQNWQLVQQCSKQRLNVCHTPPHLHKARVQRRSAVSCANPQLPLCAHSLPRPALKLYLRYDYSHFAKQFVGDFCLLTKESHLVLEMFCQS